MRHETFPTGREKIAAMPALVIPAALEPQRAALEALDGEARRAVETMIAELQDGEPGVDVVDTLWRRVGRYTKNGLTWLADTNRALVVALQRDPRLAVMTMLYVSAEGAVIEGRRSGEPVADRRMLVDTYDRLVRAMSAAPRAAA